MVELATFQISEMGDPDPSIESLVHKVKVNGKIQIEIRMFEDLSLDLRERKKKAKYKLKNAVRILRTSAIEFMAIW